MVTATDGEKDALRGNALDQRLDQVGLADEENETLARRLDPLVHLEPTLVSGVTDARAGCPLNGIEAGDGEQMVKVRDLADAVHVVDGVVEKFGQIDQIGENELLKHVGGEHRGEVTLQGGISLSAPHGHP